MEHGVRNFMSCRDQQKTGSSLPVQANVAVECYSEVLIFTNDETSYVILMMQLVDFQTKHARVKLPDGIKTTS